MYAHRPSLIPIRPVPSFAERVRAGALHSPGATLSAAPLIFPSGESSLQRAATLFRLISDLRLVLILSPGAALMVSWKLPSATWPGRVW
jgi:hypothetical protein